jgi:hypothetical protein
MTWIGAMSNCKLNGMALAEFGSVEEQKIVFDYLKQHPLDGTISSF